MSNFDSRAVKNFKQYLRIASVHPDIDYTGCVDFLVVQAAELGLPIVVEEVAARKPVVVISWEGKERDLPSLLLSSHMDVVPVYEDRWSRPPFGAEEDEQGNIYARGAQDMKCVGVQYLEAIRRLKTRGFTPKRSVHVCFTNDEEVGLLGMKLFVKTKLFEALNVGCALDEGVASPDESFNLFYADRLPYSLSVTCRGTPGYGYLLHDETAGEKASKVVKRFMELRSEEKKKLKENPELTLGDVTSINLCVVKGGDRPDVVPSELQLDFDIRLSPNTDAEEFNSWASEVCAQAGEGVGFRRLSTITRGNPTKLDSSNPWWIALKSQFNKMGLQVSCNIFPAVTDASCLRILGIPTFGFSPMNRTPVLLHDHDEVLNRTVFLKGITIYENIISSLCNV